MTNAVTILGLFETLQWSRPLWLQRNTQISTLSGTVFGSYGSVNNSEDNNLSNLLLLQQMQFIGRTQLTLSITLNFITGVLNKMRNNFHLFEYWFLCCTARLLKILWFVGKEDVLYYKCVLYCYHKILILILIFLL